MHCKDSSLLISWYQAGQFPVSFSNDSWLFFCFFISSPVWILFPRRSPRLNISGVFFQTEIPYLITYSLWQKSKGFFKECLRIVQQMFLLFCVSDFYYSNWPYLVLINEWNIVLMPCCLVNNCFVLSYFQMYERSVPFIWLKWYFCYMSALAK